MARFDFAYYAMFVAEAGFSDKNIYSAGTQVDVANFVHGLAGGVLRVADNSIAPRLRKTPKRMNGAQVPVS